jgi:rubrerythrin
MKAERKKYYCNLIFCSSLVNKKYRFGDLFQISPLPDEFNLNYDQQTHFPLLIEYSIDLDKLKNINKKEFEGIEDFMSESTLQNNWLQMLIKLLSTFTNHHFFIYGIEQSWFMPLNSGLSREELNKISSVWGFKTYHLEGLNKRFQITKLTDIDIDNIQECTHNEYYQRPNLDNSYVEITISKYTNAMFEAFMQLNDNERKYFDSAVTLIYNGQEIKDKMRSLSFISFISSIETMTSYEFRNKQSEIEFECNSCKTLKKSPFACPDCSSPIWGIGQQFKLYLKTYLTTDPKANSVINKLYGIRSKIVHSGQLLLGDNFIDWDRNTEQDKEYESHISIMQYSKLSLVNWLLKNGINKIHS